MVKTKPMQIHNLCVHTYLGRISIVSFLSSFAMRPLGCESIFNFFTRVIRTLDVQTVCSNNIYIRKNAIPMKVSVELPLVATPLSNNFADTMLRAATSQVAKRAALSSTRG